MRIRRAPTELSRWRSTGFERRGCEGYSDGGAPATHVPTNRNRILELYQKSAAGGGDDELVLSGEAYRAAQIPSQNFVNTDWSPDGRSIVCSVPAPASGNDLWLLPLGKDAKPTKFIASPGE